MSDIAIEDIEWVLNNMRKNVGLPEGDYTLYEAMKLCKVAQITLPNGKIVHGYNPCNNYGNCDNYDSSYCHKGCESKTR